MTDRPFDDPPEAPDRFAQARSARSVALMEDYVELIGDLIAEHGEARITDIAQRLGVAHPTVTKAVARLRREGLAVSRPYRGVFLTDQGAALAETVRARHRTLVSLLVALGVPPETAELDAEGMEHHVSEVTLRAFEAYLATRG
ncbi:MAG: manganese-binding transcriptional regulator MntR [Rhodobacteraceae bacterium]|nr:manganese-binding transcriptional regulator MntR [Paracoccaceae bacterium]